MGAPASTARGGAKRALSPERVAIKRAFLQQLLLSVSANPAALAALDREQVQLLKQAVLRARRAVPAPPPMFAAGQLALDLQPPREKFGHRNRKSRRRCKYPFPMIENARAMRQNGYYYKEIAAALEKHYGMAVPWITVRDWVNYYYRMRG
ncbi:MAG: hypothetical protein ACREVL_01130 [Solimonas sp.]